MVPNKHLQFWRIDSVKQLLHLGLIAIEREHLLGTPLRVVISPRNLGDGVVEITSRDKSINMKVPTGDAFDTVKKTIADMFSAIDAKVPELL